MNVFTLYLSFSSLWFALVAKRLTIAELASGLFYLEATKTDVLNPSGSIEHDAMLKMYCPNEEQRRLLHAKLVEALQVAETEGRLIWHDSRKRPPSFTVLDRLLTQNGLKPHAPVEDRLDRKQGYKYRIAKEHTMRTNPDLRVIC